MPIRALLSLVSFIGISLIVLCLPLITIHRFNFNQAQAQSVPDDPPVPSIPSGPTNVPTPPDEPTEPPQPTGTPVPTQTPTSSGTPTPEPTNTPVPTEPVESPSPSVSTSPTATPDSESGKHSRLTKDGPDCDDRTIHVTMRLEENNDRRQDIKVTFYYKGGNKQEKWTDSDGEAKVDYGYDGKGEIKAEPEQDYPTQTLGVEDLDCPGTGGSSNTGQVLGTTTGVLAAASGMPGSVELMTYSGVVLSLVGVGLKLKKGLEN